jgi:hypothetical protein
MLAGRATRCALHESCSAHEVEAVEKDQKYKFIFDSRNFVSANFPEGENPLYALIKAGKY